MKNHTTFETASALKDAGFPQPEPETGQVWYFPREESPVIVGYYNGMFDAFSAMTEERTIRISPLFFSLCVFSPTAADILREMPEMRLYFYVGRWYLEDVEDEFVLRQFSDEIAAEACAAAWLATNKKDIEK